MVALIRCAMVGCAPTLAIVARTGTARTAGASASEGGNGDAVAMPL
jgi:hypothetical protein